MQNLIESDATRIVSDAPSRRLNRTIRILSAGAKGGPGKTFLVKNLSGAAVSEGYNVGIVDFDTQRSIGKWLLRRARKSSHKPGITGYEADPTNPAMRRMSSASTYMILFSLILLRPLTSTRKY